MVKKRKETKGEKEKKRRVNKGEVEDVVSPLVLPSLSTALRSRSSQPPFQGAGHSSPTPVACHPTHPLQTMQTFVPPSFLLLGTARLFFRLSPSKCPTCPECTQRNHSSRSQLGVGTGQGSVCPQWPAVMLTSRRPGPEVGRGKKDTLGGGLWGHRSFLLLRKAAPAWKFRQVLAILKAGCQH